MSLFDILDNIADSKKPIKVDMSNDKPLSKNIRTYLASIASKHDKRSPGFHASGMYDICDRQYILERILKTESVDFIEPELRMKFLFGTSLHTFVQDFLLGPAKLIKGSWICYNCNFHYKEKTYITHPGFCGICNHDRFRYCEPRMTIAVPNVPNKPEWNIVGATDGILVSDEILDIKSISDSALSKVSKGFKSIDNLKDWTIPEESAPYEDMSARKYYVQMQLYLYGFNKKRGHILYVPKGSVDDLKSWVQMPVERDDSVVFQMFEKVKRIYTEVDRIEKNNLTIDSDLNLPEKVCSSKYTNYAKDCSVCKECFLK